MSTSDSKNGRIDEFYVKVCERIQTFQLEQLQLSVCSKARALNNENVLFLEGVQEKWEFVSYSRPPSFKVALKLKQNG